MPTSTPVSNTPCQYPPGIGRVFCFIADDRVVIKHDYYNEPNDATQRSMSERAHASTLFYSNKLLFLFIIINRGTIITNNSKGGNAIYRDKYAN